VTKDRAPSVNGNRTGVMDRIKWEMDQKIPDFTWNFTASSTNSHFVEKPGSLNMLWNLWCQVWISLNSMDLKHCQFQYFYVRNWCWKQGHLVPHRSPLDEPWDSVVTFCRYEARNMNVNEPEAQRYDWT
jgi:hypothetical protein